MKMEQSLTLTWDVFKWSKVNRNLKKRYSLTLTWDVFK